MFKNNQIFENNSFRPAYAPADLTFAPEDPLSVLFAMRPAWRPRRGLRTGWLHGLLGLLLIVAGAVDLGLTPYPEVKASSGPEWREASWPASIPAPAPASFLAIDPNFAKPPHYELKPFDPPQPVIMTAPVVSTPDASVLAGPVSDPEPARSAMEARRQQASPGRDQCLMARATRNCPPAFLILLDGAESQMNMAEQSESAGLYASAATHYASAGSLYREALKELDWPRH